MQKQVPETPFSPANMANGGARYGRKTAAECEGYLTLFGIEQAETRLYQDF